MRNLVILLGNVGADPDVKDLEFGKVANFSLATSERGYTTKDGKEIPDRTEWHRCVVKRGLAGVVEKYVKKGDTLYLEGKLQTRKYDKDGVAVYTTEILISELKMISSKKEDF
jgi:single-strand DNA-binding protein